MKMYRSVSLIAFNNNFLWNTDYPSFLQFGMSRTRISLKLKYDILKMGVRVLDFKCNSEKNNKHVESKIQISPK